MRFNFFELQEQIDSVANNIWKLQKSSKARYYTFEKAQWLNGNNAKLVGQEKETVLTDLAIEFVRKEIPQIFERSVLTLSVSSNLVEKDWHTGKEITQLDKYLFSIGQKIYLLEFPLDPNTPSKPILMGSISGGLSVAPPPPPQTRTIIPQPKRETSKAEPTPKQPEVNLTGQVFDELNGLIGLTPVKQEIAKIDSLIRVHNQKVANGIPSQLPSLHLALTGSPGTGKTTVARIIAKIYHKLGILRTDNVVEVSPRANIVGRHIGETGRNMEEIIRKSLGGVLFIDEAYSLSKEDSPRDFGTEAIDVLIAMMENYRNDTVIMIAGYTHEINKFLNTNPGLKSRFSTHIEFPDYSTTELEKIFTNLAISRGYTLGNGVAAKVSANLDIEKKSDPKNFGNGRAVRNILEKVEKNMALRLQSAMNKSMSSSDMKALLSTIVIYDVDDLMPREDKPGRQPIGFKRY